MVVVAVLVVVAVQVLALVLLVGLVGVVAECGWCGGGEGWVGWGEKKLFTLLDLCVSSLRRGHANLLCIVPILTDDLRRGSVSRVAVQEGCDDQGVNCGEEEEGGETSDAVTTNDCSEKGMA